MRSTPVKAARLVVALLWANIGLSLLLVALSLLFRHNVLEYQLARRPGTDDTFLLTALWVRLASVLGVAAVQLPAIWQLRRGEFQAYRWIRPTAVLGVASVAWLLLSGAVPGWLRVALVGQLVLRGVLVAVVSRELARTDPHPPSPPPKLLPSKGSRLTDPRIVVAGLSKRYRGVRAVDDLSFAVRPGRVTGFLGPNGSGKTTTLRMLLGLVGPTAGTATINGVRYAELVDPLRRVGALLDASAVHPGRTGRNHLRMLSTAAGLPAARVDEVLDLVGLTAAARRPVKGYSLGMRQRLGIAAAMLGDPPVLILDEPGNGLDPEGMHWLREYLRSLAEQGRTVLVSSHLLSEVQLLADDLVIIAGGRLVAHGPIDEVIGSAAGAAKVRARAPRADELVAAIHALGATATREDDGGLLISGADAPMVGAAAWRAGIELHELVAESPDLEQVFLQLTNGKAAIR